MMPLDRIEIADYQSIADLSLPLDPWVVLVGSSNSGKSAVLRALRDLFQNADSPSVVRVGAKHFEVRVGEVALRRGKSQSTYTAYGEVYAKAGRSVPEAVSNELGIPPEVIGEHYAAQLDPPFMLSLPPSQIATMLAELTESDRIGRAVSEINRRKAGHARTREIRAADAQRAKDTLETEYADLPQAQKTLEKAQSLYDSLSDDLATRDALDASVRQHGTLNETLAVLTRRREALAAKITAEASDLAHGAGERLASLSLVTEALDRHSALLKQLRKQKESKVSAQQAQETLSGNIESLSKQVAEIQESEFCPQCGQRLPAGVTA